jgi:hypothetical protein
MHRRLHSRQNAKNSENGTVDFFHRLLLQHEELLR